MDGQTGETMSSTFSSGLQTYTQTHISTAISLGLPKAYELCNGGEGNSVYI